MAFHSFHLGFNKKLLLIYTSILAASLLLVGHALYALHHNLLDDRRQKVSQLVTTSYTLVDHYYQLSLQGMSDQQAQQQAKQALRHLRYGEVGYFWVNDLETRLLVHPTQPHLEGQLQSSYQDKLGRFIFQDFVDLVQQQQAGYLHYFWPRPGQTNPVEKLSYVVLFEPWGWVLGSGIYLDEMEAIFWKEAQIYALVFLLLLVFISYLVWNILRVDARAFQSNKLMASVMEACAEAILVTDRSTRIVWANSAFQKLTGYAPNEVIGKKPGQIIASGKQDKAFYEQMWAQLEQGQHWSGELVNRHRSGQLYYEQMTITPVKNRAGKISHYVAIKNDISERKQEQLRLQEQASRDSLTGLLNRRSFLEHFSSFLQMNSKAAPGALMMLDLDHFKKINDSYGHQTGDQVLIEFAQRISKQLRKQDIFGRLGGEEFAILVPNLSLEASINLAERLCTVVQHPPMQINGLELQVTTSLGITPIPDSNQDSEQLLNLADKALYAAKNAGRACVRVHHSH